MAVDEALLESAGERGTLTLRCYEWSEPTVSLGYFQALAERFHHAPSAKCPLVRRTTGGGAIVHDRELTYSLVAPANAPLVRDARSLYGVIHGALVDVLAARGICAELARPAKRPTSDPAADPFLCFQRRAEGDVLFAGHKIGGSAQRRHRRAILQQGSILLAASCAAPELPGLNDLAERPILPTQLSEQLWTRLGQLLGLRWTRGGLTSAEMERTVSSRAGRFSAAAWTGRA